MNQMHHTRLLASLAVLLACLGTVAEAQFGGLGAEDAAPQGGIVANGFGTVKLQPQSLRLFIELQGKAGTFEEAMAKLTDREDAARMQLKAMGFAPDTIEMSQPGLDASKSQQQLQMQEMIRHQMAAAGRAMPEKKDTPKVVTLSATLVADLPLEEAPPAQLYLKMEKLKRQVAEADLAGTKEQESDLSAEQQEMIEEMSGGMDPFGEQEVKRGLPYFLFVAKITDQTREEATAMAFKNAKQEANMLARVAGVKLGPLHSLAGQGNIYRMYGGNSYLEEMGFGNDYQQQQYVSQVIGRVLGEQDEPRTNQDESFAANPASLSHTAVLSATFSVAETSQ